MKNQFLYGVHAVKAALLNPRRKNKTLFLTKKTQEKMKDIRHLPPVKIVQPDYFESLVPAGTVHQHIVLETHPLECLPLETFCQKAPNNTRLVVLDQVTDPHNIGAILRAAAALEADALLVTAVNSADLMGGTVAKVASGALEHVPVISVTNLAQTLKYLQSQDFWCYGFDEKGDDLRHTKDWSGKLALIFGAEGSGLRRLTKESCDGLLRVPTSESFSTLNVSTTVSVVLYATKV